MVSIISTTDPMHVTNEEVYHCINSDNMYKDNCNYYNDFNKYTEIIETKNKIYYNKNESKVYKVDSQPINHSPVKQSVPKFFKDQKHFHRNSYKQDSRTTSHIPAGANRRSLRRSAKNIKQKNTNKNSRLSRKDFN